MFLSIGCMFRDLDIDVRKQLVLKELLGYHADIVCLQECDKTVFETYYQPHMEINGAQCKSDCLKYWLLLGFECNFMAKGGTTLEGEALFVRKSRFKVSVHKVHGLP